MKTTGDIIGKAYSPEEFQKDASKLINIISGELEVSLSDEAPKTIEWCSPERQLEFWREDFTSSDPVDFPELIKRVM